MRLDHLSDDDFQFAMNYVDNEGFQNQTLFPFLRDEVLAGSDVDYIKANDETFGLQVDNPVPVNGPVGQQTYLSRLRTPEGLGFLFHRIGSNSGIDIYEIMSFDGEYHLEVFMDMYHPRRSRLPLPGLKLVEEPQALTGFTTATKVFPLNYARYYSQQNEDIRVAFATPEQMKLIIDHLYTALLEFEPDEEDDSSTDQTSTLEDYSWRNKISDDEWAKAKELRGFIVPTPKDGFRVFEGPGGIYGWTPSTAKARRMKMEIDDLYDPVAVLVLEGIKNYYGRLPEDAGSFMNISPDHVYFDESGFYTTFRTIESSDDLSEASDLMDFLTEYYFKTRTYPIESWLSRGDGISDDGPENQGHLNFRWKSSMGSLGGKYEVRQSNKKREKPFLINSNGSLTRLDPVVIGLCPLCGEETVLWAGPELRLVIKKYRVRNDGEVIRSLSATEREALMTGIHDWCFV